MNNAELEQEVIEKGLTAPRITLKHIESIIVDIQYYVFPLSQLTACCLTLQNGFTVLGESACASPDNFNQALGEKLAKENAVSKIWRLEGYLLKQQLFGEKEK